MVFIPNLQRKSQPASGPRVTEFGISESNILPVRDRAHQQSRQNRPGALSRADN
jgi:hypothetical protein